jgi:hypothetical protein
MFRAGQSFANDDCTAKYDTVRSNSTSAAGTGLGRSISRSSRTVRCFARRWRPSWAGWMTGCTGRSGWGWWSEVVELQHEDHRNTVNSLNDHFVAPASQFTTTVKGGVGADPRASASSRNRFPSVLTSYSNSVVLPVTGKGTSKRGWGTPGSNEVFIEFDDCNIGGEYCQTLTVATASVRCLHVHESAQAYRQATTISRAPRPSTRKKPRI